MVLREMYAFHGTIEAPIYDCMHEIIKYFENKKNDKIYEEEDLRLRTTNYELRTTNYEVEVEGRSRSAWK